MKLRNLIRKTGSVLLTAAMFITSFPAHGREVYAAELPGSTAFAAKEQLKAFNTDDTDGSSNPAKLCFGKDGQEWWIAGSQRDDSLTLFAASPLATKQQLNPNNKSGSGENKPYDVDWGCHYSGEVPSEVYPNHYGASPLRTTLKGLETSFFSTAEQGLMNDTIIYTDDIKERVYSTTNKLYLAYGDGAPGNNQYVTVGANASDTLNNGLRIDKAYWGSDVFWVRTMYADNVSYAWAASQEWGVAYDYASSYFALVPAFELNLSSVLFASAVKAVSSGNVESGTIADGTAMTLRLNDAAKAIGTLKYDGAAGQIAAQKDENAEGDVSLVVQGNDGGKDWYYSVPVEETKVVTKRQIQDACNISTEIAFAKCKIWLETSIDNVVYAKMPEKQITITAEDQSVMWGNDPDQSAYTISEDGLIAGDRISEITLTPAGAELTDNGTIAISGVKIANAEGEDVTGSYDITLVKGKLKITHNTTLAPDRIEAVKTKTSYKAGEALKVDDLAVTAYYADGYSRGVTEFTTNAADIDMSVAGDKTLTVSYTENGGTKTADITIKVSASLQEPTKKPQETITPGDVKKNSEKLDSGISVKWKGKALALKWTKIAGAEGFDIFAARSGKKLNQKSFAKTVKSGKTSVFLKRIAGKKISGRKAYSVKINAWKYVDGKKVYTGSSRTYHTAGKQNKKYTNVKKLKPKRKKYTLKKGRSLTMKVTIVKEARKKKLLPKSCGPALQYRSGNENTATVTKRGKVKAKKKGSCYIYVTALNGVRSKIRITVK